MSDTEEVQQYLSSFEVNRLYHFPHNHNQLLELVARHHT